MQEHPSRERLRGQLMLALYRAGRQAEALNAYRAGRTALVESFGIEPGRPLRELQQAILRQDRGLDLQPASEPATENEQGAFVGREAELAELRAGLESALTGRGRLFLLVGEPGIGKSRLADELIRHARGRGTNVLTGRCWEAGGAPAYWPWTQSLRAYIRTVEPETLRSQLGAGAAELAQIVPELRDVLPDLPAPRSPDSDGARFRLFDATAEFLRSASETRPLVLVLDDLHAADAPSLLLLQVLTRELGSARMLVVVACRDVDPVPGEALSDLLAELAREPVARRLSLGGLREQDVAEYVHLTAYELNSDELVRALHEETEGNPLFVTEMVRLLSVEGIESPATGPARLAIPQSVRDVIARRLTHLSEQCNQVLPLASVLGREFALSALARLSSVAEADLLETLDEAVAARVLSSVPGGPGRLRFAHVLIRDTLYEELATTRRVRLHRQAVVALEALYGNDPGPHLAELARHAIAGSDPDTGVEYAHRAGDRALALLAYEEAARLYRTALEALDLTAPPKERTRCELLLSLGIAEGRAGNTPTANAALLDAAALARRLDMPHELALAAAEYGGRMVWARAGDDPRLVPLLEEGLAALPGDDVRLRARLLARLGALRDEPSRDRRDTFSKDAVELARRTADPAALAHALDGRAMAILAPDTVAECLAIAGELIEVAEEIGDREGLVHGYMQRVSVRIVLGDIDAAEDDLAAATPIAEQLGQPAHLWDLCAARAMLAIAAGALSEAEDLVEHARALGERTLPSGAIPVYLLQRYTLLDFRGELEEVEQEIRELVVRYPARPVFRCVLVHLHARVGRASDAKRALDELGVDEFSTLPFDQEWLFAMGFLAEVSALLADPGSALALYELLAPWAALNVADPAEGIRGSASRYLGILAATTMRWEAAGRHFEDALAMNAEMGARPWLAHTQHDYARMLLARDGPADRERAQELLGTALATYRELGMESHAAKASALAQRREVV